MSGHGHEEHGDSHHDSDSGHEEHDVHESHEEHDDSHESHEEHSESHAEHVNHESHGEHSKHAEHSSHGSEEAKSGKVEKVFTKRKLSETKFLMLLGIAVFGRLLLKEFPVFVSVEPIIPIAVYVGLVYGSDGAILIGLLAYPLSNIFLEGGLFGVWSILQSLGGAIAGAIAGFKNFVSSQDLVYYSVLGTLIFEIIVNIPDGAILVWPFSFIHIFSNLLFAFLIGLFIEKK